MINRRAPETIQSQYVLKNGMSKHFQLGEFWLIISMYPTDW